MKRIILLGGWLVVIVFFTGTAMTQDLVIYPAKGQSQAG